MSSLTSADVQSRLAAAIQAEDEAASHHRRTTAAAVLAGVEGSAEEKQAAKAHLDAKGTTARLRDALAAVLATEQAQRSRLERDALDATDAGCLKAAQDLQTAAARITAGLEAYVRGWQALLSAGDAARTQIGQNPRLRGDLLDGLPSSTDLVSQELTRLAAALPVTPPGAKESLRLYGDTAALQPLATRLQYITDAVVSDLARAKRSRDRKAEVAEDWTRE